MGLAEGLARLDEEAHAFKVLLAELELRGKVEKKHDMSPGTRPDSSLEIKLFF